jgi:glycerol-3-phosphate dehydrogenase
VLTHMQVTGMLRDRGRVAGVTAQDAFTGEELTVRASVVVNAAGVWAADVQAMAGAATFAVRPAKGVHLVVAQDAFDSRTGILARAGDSVIILRRWFGHWLLGTTDTAYAGDRRRPTVEQADVDYLLRNVNRYLARPLTRSDVLAAFAGLRPLLAPVTRDALTTSALSRDHTVVTEPAGMVTVVGGKYTTYRRMARDAVDEVGHVLGRPLPPSPTADLPLVGAAGWPAVTHRASRLAAEHGVPEEHVRRMLHRYGDEVPVVLAPVRAEPGLGTPLPDAPGYLPAEFRHAVTHEGACTLSDVLTRRTRLAIEQADGGSAVAPAVAALISPLLGWDAERQAAEVAAHRAEVAADRAAIDRTDRDGPERAALR